MLSLDFRCQDLRIGSAVENMMKKSAQENNHGNDEDHRQYETGRVVGGGIAGNAGFDVLPYLHWRFGTEVLELLPKDFIKCIKLIRHLTLFFFASVFAEGQHVLLTAGTWKCFLKY